MAHAPSPDAGAIGRESKTSITDEEIEKQLAKLRG